MTYKVITNIIGKLLSAILLVGTLAFSGMAQDTTQGIVFIHTGWEDVKATAKKENKPIFIDFYTDWCAPCKFMAQTIFPLKNVGDFYNKHFVCVQIDAEKGEGVAIARKYGINAYPTMIFTNDKEEVIHRALGSSDADEFIGQGNLALTSSHDEMAVLKARYDKNELDKDGLYRYFLQVKAAGKNKETAEVFDQYFALAANVSADMFNTITTNIDAPDSKAFIYLEEHRDEFAGLVGKDKVDNYIRHTQISYVVYTAYKSEEEYRAAMDTLKAGFHLTEEEVLNIDVDHYCQTRDKERFMAAASKLATDYYYPGKNDFQLSNLIGGAYRFNFTGDELLVVKSWAEHAVAIKDNALNNCSLAIIYKQLKNKELALKYVNKAMEDCRRDKEPFIQRIEMYKKEIENADYSPQGIAFNSGNWEAVKATARAQGKLIFIDFGTSWCAPCRYMVQNIFPQKEVGNFYNKNFICMTVDAEKGEGVMLARKYQVSGFPTLIFVNSEEKVIYRVDSSLNVAELIAQGKIALTPQDDYAGLKEKYLKNELNKADLYRYLLIVKTKGNAGELNEVLEKYVASAPDVTLQMFNTIVDNVRSPGSKAFVFLEAHQSAFGRMAGKDKVENFIRDTYIKDATYKKYKTGADYTAAIDSLKRKIHLTRQEELNIADSYYCNIGDKDGFMRASGELAVKYDTSDDVALSRLIGASFGFHLTQDELLIVKSWAERALLIKNNSVNALGLAMIYKDLKNKEQALKYINQSLEDSLKDKDHEEEHIAVFKKQIEEAAY